MIKKLQNPISELTIYIGIYTPGTAHTLVMILLGPVIKPVSVVRDLNWRPGLLKKVFARL